MRKKCAGVNYCHEQKAADSVNGLLEKNGKDKLIIKLVALRAGLCSLVDAKKIPLESAIDIFEEEKNRAIVERSKEELMSSPEHAL